MISVSTRRATPNVLDKPTRFGFYDHVHLAVTPERLPLGLVGDEMFDREPNDIGREAKANRRRLLPIEEKETFRWLTGYRLASELAGEHPNTQVVNVADREADIYDIYVEAERQETPAGFVIRGKSERRTTLRDPEAGPNTYRKVESLVRWRLSTA